MSDLFIDGPSGRLEADYAAAGPVAALLCHPHPMMGGTKDDMNLASLHEGLQASGVGTLRFNFRGAGLSEGAHDEGAGEVNDVMAAAGWLRNEAGCEKLLLAGYSFGGAMALAAQPTVSAAALLLLAPAWPMVTFEDPDVETLLLFGERDQFIDVQQSRQRFSGALCDVRVLAGADHFFAAEQSTIRDAAKSFGERQVG